MRYGSAMVEKVIDGRKHVIRVRVAVERSRRPGRSYTRYGEGITKNGVSVGVRVGAWSGARFATRFAREKVDPEYFGIEIQEINGDLDSRPDASEGAAVASAVATWIACGADWKDADLVDTYGWSLRRPARG
jgi:hypothetical protein